VVVTNVWEVQFRVAPDFKHHMPVAPHLLNRQFTCATPSRDNFTPYPSAGQARHPYRC